MVEARAERGAGTRLLTVEAVARLDAAAIADGVPGFALMEAAGAAVAERAAALLSPGGRVLVLCGPGNNGGDGFVAARHLVKAGFPTDVVPLGKIADLKGDAAQAAARWTGSVHETLPEDLSTYALVIDALFGAGLSRDLDGAARAMVEAAAASHLPVLAVDMPSGVDGDSGAIRGAVLPATETVTFVAMKAGHLLEPGRGLCGRVHVAQIGAGRRPWPPGWRHRSRPSTATDRISGGCRSPG